MEKGLYRWSLEVPEDALDENGHVNNVVYVGWMQEVANRHADSLGCTRETRAAGAMWVVYEHRIRYLKPAFAGDLLEVRTWVEKMRFAQSTRHTEIARLEGGGEVILSRGATEYVFVDAQSGMPRRIPPEVSGVFTFLERAGT
ncbi:MAG: thioesterase family protein [Acidobacteriota bacterium]